jgi:hypothetical protein
MAMRRHQPARSLATFAAALIVGSCAGAPPELGYRLPASPSVVYAYGDTTLVDVAIMGQSMEIAMRGDADYGVSFATAASGIEVTLTVDRLDASLTLPMAETERLDASEVRGPLVFTLDGEGDATVVSTPEVSMAASRMLSGLTTAHSFFPGLPDRVVSVGDSWVDSITFEGDAELGAMTEATVYEYRVVGDTVIDGRPLVEIGFTGSSRTSNSMNMSGMTVAQSSIVELDGHVLWDERAGIMFEMVRRGEGGGTVRIPMSPQPLPITVRITQRARLVEG